jgi:D-glycero-D-manno-heptose 1,7-bisphosphate phosphatase
MSGGMHEMNLSQAGIGRAVTGEFQRVSLRAIRSAMFIDRDGTLIKDVGYLKSPDDVELIPHAANAVRRMNYALRPVIVVTNQSGIARGMLTEVDYERVRARVDDLLAERGAYIDAHYHCPHHPDYTGPCDCRKPRLGLFERAIHEHAIDAQSSLFVGNRWTDIEPAQHYLARGVLVPSDETPADEIERAVREAEVAQTLTDVVHMILPG